MNKGVFVFWGIFIIIAIMRFGFSVMNHGIVPVSCEKEIIFGTGKIIQEPERKESGQIFVVKVDEIIYQDQVCAKNLRIRMKSKLYPRFVYGDRVSFEGKLSRPFNFKSDSGRSFDYEGYLAKDDVFYEIKSALVVLEHESVSSKKFDFEEKLSLALFSLKRSFVSGLEHVLGEPHAALAAGLVVGEKSALGSDLLEDFRIVGLIHIVVLSGFNITIVGDAMRKILSFLPRAWGIIVGGLGIVLFGILVGGGATVVRSCFMAGIALSADLIRRDYKVTRALILAGLIMVIHNPMIVLHDPSFQLSFLATLGLIILASPIERFVPFVTERFGIRGIVSATVATQIFVSPYILYMMGSVSIIGMVVNILVLPIIPVTMLAVFLAGMTGMMWIPLSIPFAWLSHMLLSYELTIVRWFADIPYASLNVPIFSKWWVVVFYGIFAVVLYVITKIRVEDPEINKIVK